MEQMTLFEDNAEYDAFVDKFRPKKTTDDCYTPALVYDAVADWVAREYGVERGRFVRPFWPGRDFQAEEYREGDIVVDNPPFSIFAEIIKFYQKKGVKFFLFGPALTLFSGATTPGVCYIPVGADITYQNEAKVKTSFVTNLDRWRVRSAPDLYQAIKEANREAQKAGKKELQKYAYPDQVITAAMVQQYSIHGVEFQVAEAECVKIPGLDAQKKEGKSIFGGGFLLSERAAAERAAAERAAAERAVAERAAAVRWRLSQREWGIVRRLSAREGDI